MITKKKWSRIILLAKNVIGENLFPYFFLLRISSLSRSREYKVRISIFLIILIVIVFFYATHGYCLAHFCVSFLWVGIVSRGNSIGGCPVLLSTIELIIVRSTVLCKIKMDGYDWTAEKFNGSGSPIIFYTWNKT
jgi:hypothetical protein